MKFNVLASIAHNIADSMSGCSFLTGCHGLSPFEDAARSPGAYVELDLLSGRCTHGEASADLLVAAEIVASEALPRLCAKSRVQPGAFKALLVRYQTDALGPWLEVTVENAEGRRRTDRYLAWPARRIKKLDPIGRVRTERPHH
jgi:hypothetical protein